MSKVCVIGLDGGTFAVIDYLVDQGRLPNFAALMQKGSRAVLESTIPPLTPAAWTSFFTASNPGKTGAVGFFRFRPGTYRMEPMNAANLQGTPFWKLAGDRGKRVCVYNVPVTYPAAPVNGIMISGMDAPRFNDKAIFPLEYKQEFLSAIPDFRISEAVDAPYLLRHSADPTGSCIEQLSSYLDMEVRVINHLMAREDWDLFVAVLRSPDCFQHIFWDDVEKALSGAELGDDERRRAEAVFSCYEAVDRQLGKRWLDWCRDRDIIFMSDHGFGTLGKDICLNRILAEAGLLAFREADTRRQLRQRLAGRLKAHISTQTRQKIKKALGRDRSDDRWNLFVDSLVADIDWSRTRLCAIAQHGCLFVNLKGRDPLGVVDGEEERQSVLAEAEAVLSRLRDPDDGQPVVTEFYRKEDIYGGPLFGSMPDMVINMRDWSWRGIYSTSVELAEESLFRRGGAWKELSHTGNHRREGILMMHGPDVAAGRLGQVPMVDVAPTIMRLLGLPGAPEWDGKVISGALTDSAAGPLAEGSGYRDAVSAGGGEVYSDDDESEIRKRLENLGYL